MNFSDMVNSGYFMYMAEAQGMDNLVNTRTAKLNAIKHELSSDPSFEELESVCLNHGISSLDEDEYNYILHK